jgi:NADH:ubiquinone oxidoreductase subunit E
MAFDHKNNDNGDGVWRAGRSGKKGRSKPKGRALLDDALDEVQALVGKGPLRRDLLIEYLHLIQDTYGHQSAGHFDPIREDEAPPPDLTIRVCDSLSCELAGSEALIEALEAGHDPAKVRVLRAPCMGRCDTAPVLEIGHRHIDHATPKAVDQAILARDFDADIPAYETLAQYRAQGGYDTLAKLRADGDWETVQETVLSAGLRGLGGAGFPSGRKWGFVRANPGPRYMAVNGDEGEPGTFKDRYYLERVPHLFLKVC